jgi:mannitol operon repressor
MSYALALITKIEYGDCEIIRRVRNEFAHQLHGLTFGNQQIADWRGNLKAMPSKSVGARQRLVGFGNHVCMVLWYRPGHAAMFAAQDRSWPWHLAKEPRQQAQ